MIKTIVILLVAAFQVVFLSGCNDEPSVTSKVSNSVAQMKKYFNNFEGLDIVTCELTIETHSKKSYIPAPSDTWIEYFGWLELSEESYMNIENSYKWQAVNSVEGIDKRLSPMLQGKEVLTSNEFNKTFSYSPYYRDGFILKAKGIAPYKLYIAVKRVD